MKENRIPWITGTLLIFVSLLIVSVSAFIIEKPSNPIIIKLNQGILGNITEGQTLHYTPNNTSALDDVIHLTTSKTNTILFFDTDLDAQSCNYATYQIFVKVSDNLPTGSNFSTGDTIATLTLTNPDTSSGIGLDVAGDWTFDFEITTTSNSGSSDQVAIVNITVSAESASA